MLFTSMNWNLTTLELSPLWNLAINIESPCFLVHMVKHFFGGNQIPTEKSGRRVYLLWALLAEKGGGEWKITGMCNSTIIFHDRLLDYSIFSGAKMTSGIILRIPIISQPTQMATLSCVAHIKSAHFCLPCTARIYLVILSLSNRYSIFVLGFLMMT